MNNKTLWQSFNDIMNMSNPLDQICQLKQMQKEYKKSEFYKLTKMNIYKAYEMTCKTQYSSLVKTIQSLLTDDNLSEYINNVFETVHLDVLFNNMLRSINYDQLNEFISDLIPDLDIKQIQQITQQLKELIEK